MNRTRKRRPAVASLSFLLLAAAPAAAQLRFDGGRTFDVSTLSGDALFGDVDGDGHLDLVASRACSGPACGMSAAWLAGDGTGAFTPAATVDFASRLVAATVGDIDGDGRADLLFAASGDPDLLVYSFAAGGGISGPVRVPAGGTAKSVLPADCDGDGRTDVVLAVGGGLRVLRREASGAFVVASTRDLGGTLLSPLAADFDGDGRVDVAGTLGTGALVLFGDGAGGWSAAVPLSSTTPGRISRLAAADFDEDGNIDLAASDAGADAPDSLRLFVGDGSRGFADGGAVAAGAAPASLRALDVDSDGHADLAALTAAGAGLARTRLTVLRGAGDGTFRAPRHVPSGGTILSPADLDEDGRVDFVARDGGRCVAHFGDGAGGFSGLEILETARAPRLVRAGDFTLDGLPDLLVATASPASEVRFHAADGRGGFLAGRLVASGAVALSEPADFDEDGRLDVAAADAATGVTVRFGDGGGGFPRSAAVATGGAAPAARLLSGDCDANGHADLIAALADGTIAVLLGNGDGTFAAPLAGRLASVACAVAEVDVAAADFDGDGRLDLAAALRSGPTGTSHCLTVVRGSGDGRFGAPVLEVGLAPDAARVAVGDFDEDGRADVAVASASGGVATWLGSADGTPRRGASAPLGFEPAGLAVADVDADGHLDLAASEGAGGTVAVLRGDGRGGFEAPARFPAGRFPREIAAADIDSDDDVDLVAAARGSDAVVILRNESPIPLFDCRIGNVNAAAGAPADVMFVNGSIGNGRARRLFVQQGTRYTVRLDAPPSNPAGPAPLVMWGWFAGPTPSTLTKLPRGLGIVGLPTPLTPARGPQPRLIANSLGSPSRLGVERWPNMPTAPAPTLLLLLRNGVRRSGTFYYQGLIADSAGPDGVTALTNGIEVIVR